MNGDTELPRLFTRQKLAILLTEKQMERFRATDSVGGRTIVADAMTEVGLDEAYLVGRVTLAEPRGLVEFEALVPADRLTQSLHHNLAEMIRISAYCLAQNQREHATGYGPGRNDPAHIERSMDYYTLGPPEKHPAAESWRIDGCPRCGSECIDFDYEWDTDNAALGLRATCRGDDCGYSECSELDRRFRWRRRAD